jgi:SAM-dependent methyltransferase
VLFQGLPPVLNAALHSWHAAIVTQEFAPYLPHGAWVADIACGYGRLSAVLRAWRPDLRLVGIDYSLTYCRQYGEQDLGAVLCADLDRLPLQPESLDATVIVTGLMYALADQRANVLTAILNTVRKGGVALLLDPGAEIANLLGQLRPNLRRRSTGGSAFTLEEYDLLARRPGWRLVASGGNPFFTLCLPLLLPSAGRSYLARRLARWAVRWDSNRSASDGLLRFALHRWMIVKRDNDGTPG